MSDFIAKEKERDGESIFFFFIFLFLKGDVEKISESEVTTGYLPILYIFLKHKIRRRASYMK